MMNIQQYENNGNKYKNFILDKSYLIVKITILKKNKKQIWKVRILYIIVHEN